MLIIQEETMKKFKFMFLALMVFCFGIVVPGCTQSKTGPAPEVSAGKWINVDNFKLADNTDKIVIVEFWATWCPPCRKSIPHLKELHEKYKDKGVVLVSLTNEPAETILEFNKKAGMTWVVGAESNSGQAYGVSGIPAAYIVADGKIVWNGHPMSGLDAEIEKLVAARASTTVAPAPAPAAVEVTPAPVVEESSDEASVEENTEEAVVEGSEGDTSGED